MTTEQLKPCSHCKGTDLSRRENAKGVYVGIFCFGCGTEVEEKHYNTRPIEDSLRAKLAIAVEALELISSNWSENYRATADDAINKIRGCE